MKRFQNLCVLPVEIDAVLVANGDPVPLLLLRRIVARSRVVVALDGGVKQLHRAQIARLLLGDLDSAGRVAVTWVKKVGARVVKDADQERSDFDKGLAWVDRQKWQDVAILSAYGGRPDHLLAVMDSLSNVHRTRFIVVTAKHLMIPLAGRRKLNLSLAQRTVLSWQSLSAASSCTLSGVRWSFSNKTLKSGGFKSLSNIVIDGMVTVSQRTGHSWLTISLDP